MKSRSRLVEDKGEVASIAGEGGGGGAFNFGKGIALDQRLR